MTGIASCAWPRGHLHDERSGLFIGAGPVAFARSLDAAREAAAPRLL